MLVPAGLEALNVASFDFDAVTPEEIVQMAAVPPFGGEWRLLVIAGVTQAPGEGGRRKKAAGGDGLSALLAYAGRPSPMTCLVFTSDENLGSDHPLHQAVRLKGRVVPAAPLPRGGLAAWVAREASALGKELSTGAAELLCQSCGEDRVHLRSELRKLACYVGERVDIRRDDVLAVVGRSREESVFEIFDSIGAGKPDRALVVLREIIRQGDDDPSRILALLANQMRQIRRASGLVLKGEGVGGVAAHLKVKDFVARKLVSQARCYGEAGIQPALERILDADLAIKKGTMDARMALELLCVRLADIVRGTRDQPF